MRLKYLDFLREIALFYMFFQHAVLVLLKPHLNDGIILFLFEIVPFCPALFLFLSGFSITLYLKKNDIGVINIKYFFHLAKRGILLIICASILFIIEHGFQFPDFIFCGNILNTIGWMIIISGALLMLKKNEIIFPALLVLLTVMTIVFDVLKIYIIPFNFGYEPMSPTIIFGFMGVTTGLLMKNIKQQKNERNFIIASGAIGLLLFSLYSVKYGIFKVFFSDIGRYFIEREFNEKYLLQNIISGEQISSTYFAGVWNYNSECFIAAIGFTLLMFAISYFLENSAFKFVHHNLFIPGKFAFINYFYHLSIIGLFIVIFGYNFMNTFHFVSFIALLFAFSYILSFFSQFIKIRMKKDK